MLQRATIAALVAGGAVALLVAMNGCESGGDDPAPSGDPGLPTADFRGAWQAVHDSDGRTATGTLTQNGATVNGTCRYDTGEDGEFHGTAAGNTLRGHLDVGSTTWDVQATLSGNTLTGTWGEGGSGGAWHATR